MSDLHRQLSSYLMVEYHVSAHMIATASDLTMVKSFLDTVVAYFALHQNTIISERLLLDLCRVRFLFVMKCCHTSLGSRGRGRGRGRAISILIYT